MSDKLFKLGKRAEDLVEYLDAIPERDGVMDRIHAINMAYAEWAWELDRGLELKVD